MKKILLLIAMFFLVIGLQACSTEEIIIDEPVVEEPIDFCAEDFVGPLTPEQQEECVIEEPTLNIIQEYTFGQTVKFGYAEGELTWEESGQQFTLFKNRVQINTSTFGYRENLGAFLVFAPIKDAEYSFIEFSIDEGSLITFEHITWHSTNGPANISGLELAEIRLEVLRNDEWIILDFLDLIPRVNGEDMVEESFELAEAGNYRLVYFVKGARSTTNTQYALIIDNLRIFE